MPNINELQHKAEGKQVLYFNGIKWLVRETFKSKKEAVLKLKELCLK